MLNVTAQFKAIHQALLRVGFLDERLKPNVPIPDRIETIPLVAFSNEPFDSRTASIAVLQGQHEPELEIASVRPIGAPLVLRCLPYCYELWKQGIFSPEFHLRLEHRELARFFEDHRSELAPESIYRAKVWGRLEHSFQLDFVDAGFLPLVEEEAGRKLTHLVERLVADAKDALGWTVVSEADGRWLLKAIFWLFAAKVLKDKTVPGFIRLELTDIENVYARLARHYNGDHPRPVQIRSRQRRDALVSVAEQVKSFSNCGSISTEALAQLYESALIDRATRQKLGTHSTPTWLVDYIIGRLRPWIENGIAVEDRRVFEPACGHAAFLIAAMRMLSELLPTSWHQPRHIYLRERLHGIEADSFALEIARLSLTLADVPNPNGWALTEQDMFKDDRLSSGVRRSTIALGNPPFENFEPSERQSGWLPNKAAETFRRVIEHLPIGGVFGFVLPQTFLRAKQAANLIQTLVSEYEIAEISLFADKVFRYGEPETAIILGRRMARPGLVRQPIRYQRIREWQLDEFALTYRPGSRVDVTIDRFVGPQSTSLLVPDLVEVWDALEGLPEFHNFALVGQGFSHKADGDPTLPSGAIKVSRTPKKGLVVGFNGWKEDQMTHALPEIVWLNLSPSVIANKRHGTRAGVPQVLLNYARISREAWRLKALIDEIGHPVTSRFLVVRPRTPNISLLAIWALCNSPVANAYAYCLSGKRNILAGDIRRMRVPDLSTVNLSALEHSVTLYLDRAKGASRNGTSRLTSKHRKDDPRQLALEAPNDIPQSDTSTAQELRFFQWRVDREVLRLYNLPSDLERKVLDLFYGIRRRGVPFEQMEYFPKDFIDVDRLDDLLAITADWPKTNRRRAHLMDLDESGDLTTSQAAELQKLQRLADASISLTEPVNTVEIDRVVEIFRRRGLWTQ